MTNALLNEHIIITSKQNLYIVKQYTNWHLSLYMLNSFYNDNC